MAAAARSAPPGGPGVCHGQHRWPLPLDRPCPRESAAGAVPTKPSVLVAEKLSVMGKGDDVRKRPLPRNSRWVWRASPLAFFAERKTRRISLRLFLHNEMASLLETHFILKYLNRNMRKYMASFLELLLRMHIFGARRRRHLIFHLAVAWSKLGTR